MQLSRVARKARTAALTETGRRSLAQRLRFTWLVWTTDLLKGAPVTCHVRRYGSFVVHPFEKTSLGVYLAQEYEPLETAVLSELIELGDVVMDVGANVGYYTVLLSRLVGAHGRVLSCEPSPMTFPRLVSTVQLLRLDNVVLHESALGESVGLATMAVSLGGCEPQQALTPWAGLTGPTARVQVAITTADDLARHSGACEPAFIKLDVEGAEPLVLRGAGHILSSVNRPMWLLEVNPLALAASGSRPAELGTLLAGYEFWACPLDRRTTGLRRWSWDDTVPTETHNVFCLPLSGRFARRHKIPPRLLEPARRA